MGPLRVTASWGGGLVWIDDKSSGDAQTLGRTYPECGRPHDRDRCGFESVVHTDPGKVDPLVRGQITLTG